MPVLTMEYWIYERTSENGGYSWTAGLEACDKRKDIGRLHIPIPRGHEGRYGLGKVVTVTFSEPRVEDGEVERFRR